MFCTVSLSYVIGARLHVRSPGPFALRVYSWVRTSDKDLRCVVYLTLQSFKGTDETFGGFPDRLKHLLTETIENLAVECIVFPAYEVCFALSPCRLRLNFVVIRQKESWCGSKAAF